MVYRVEGFGGFREVHEGIRVEVARWVSVFKGLGIQPLKLRTFGFKGSVAYLPGIMGN